ncbi:hypothetical protein [Cellulomonas alba]|uniref:MotA/TolQ/ExbB proton channel domain-containing protein n=1 Tax=Cellulomonas alba TaxID=3053467 RepID=A0ABT7SFE5_9CELL|nr:hypothetical protein [Cellulomonas alba]MDM7854895.1 hypothetical protein [Cellulomonas alba]
MIDQPAPAPSSAAHSRPARSTTPWIVAAVAATVTLGPVGLAAVGEVWLLRAHPTSASQRNWRLFGLTALTTAFVTGLVGGIVGLVLGLEHPPTAWFAFIEGGIAGGVLGLLLGSCVGAVLVAVSHRQSAAE